jgi:RNA polymerase sigma factor (sigma-70 family)
MKSYNVPNYVLYKDDVAQSQPENKMWDEYTRDELIIKFLPLVENIARKFSTASQASGVLDITDLIQEGSIGLIAAIDKLDWSKLDDSEDLEKTLKSFLSKRIKGSIRRAIDINRGNIKVPEHKLNEIRKNPDDEKSVALFFNSIFSSYDDVLDTDENYYYDIEDKQDEYNIDILNKYLLSIMEKHLSPIEYDVLRLSYGLDCDKYSANEIALMLNINVSTAIVRVSQIKRDAINQLIKNVTKEQVLDLL